MNDMEDSEVKSHNYVSGAHNRNSWLDHVIYCHSTYSKLSNITILDMPVQAIFDFNYVHDCIDNYACTKDKVSYNWSKCTAENLLQIFL